MFNTKLKFLMGFSLVAMLAVPAEAQQRQPNFFELLFGIPPQRQAPRYQPPRQPDPRIYAEPQVNEQPTIRKTRRAPIAAQAATAADPELTIPGLGMGTVDYVPPLTVVVFDPTFAALKSENAETDIIRQLLADKSNPVRAQEPERKAILAFYKANGFKPQWLENGRPSSKAEAFLKFVSTADKDGLLPKNYRPEVLTGFEDIHAAVGGDANRLARLEVGLTVSALHLARHMSAGQFEPNRLSLYHDMRPEPVNGEEALKALASSSANDLPNYFHNLSPKQPQYTALKDALGVLSTGEAVPFTAIATGPAVKPGKTDPRVPALRERLAQLGFTGKPDARAASDPKLDQDLVIALMAFQTATKLKPTGVLDNASLNLLNKNNSGNKREKIIASMERLRWLPKNLGERYVFVNQAAYDVHVIDHDQTVWQSKVIVGQPTKQTYAFYDQIQTVVFNPKWGVPVSIIINEYGPKMRRDPSYLERNGFVVVDLKGQEIDSRSVDWYNIGINPNFGIQQLPGGDNALGELKFLFPNSHDIYMHDTPTKPLFKTAERAYSHGCVRVQNPREFAEVLLGWNKDQVVKSLASNPDTHSIQLAQKVPVYLTYFTAWTDERGALTFHNDIYGRDTAITKALNYDPNFRKTAAPAIAQGSLSGGLIQN